MKNITFILIFLISILGYSQIISGKITDIDNKPISGARIGIENTDFGDQSDENGNFEIDFTNFDKNSNKNLYLFELTWKSPHFYSLRYLYDLPAICIGFHPHYFDTNPFHRDQSN